MRRTSISRILRQAVTYVAIVLVTLAAIDVVTITLGLFPPTYHYGDPTLGWRPAPASGAMRTDKCWDPATGDTVRYQRNEDGVRTRLSARELMVEGRWWKVVVVGDSQTELCSSDSTSEFAVLERALRQGGIANAAVLEYAAGRYSPLQAYLAFRDVPRKYHPQALIMNIYTGNDFYDLLRVDDRPYFVAAGDGYRIVKPVWYLYDDPSVRYHSRVLFALRSLYRRSGLRGVLVRVHELDALARQYGQGYRTVFAYMSDLRKSIDPAVGYAAAFSAQMLNQQLFFYHFPAARAESLRRMEALMELVRQENPGMQLVMSPLPSYQLAHRQPVDSLLPHLLRRLPLTYEQGVDQEQALYQALRALAAKHGWLFVDNLAALRAYSGGQRLYNDFDYHLLPVATTIIGEQQARALLESRVRPHR